MQVSQDEQGGELNVTKFSNQSCDRCFTRKKRCSMHLPICQRCASTSNTCSYERNLARKRITPQHKLLGLERKPKPLDAEKIVSIVAERKLQVPSTKFFLRELYIEGIQRPILTLYLSLANLKVFSFQKQDLALILAIKQISTPPSKLLKPKVKPIIILKAEKPSIVGYGTECQFLQAIDTYFKYLNLFKPLFTKKMFFTKKRSRFLVLAVFGAGLQLMDLDKCQFDWIPQLYKEIILLIKKNYFNPSLDTLQAMVIVNDSFFSVPEVFAVACKCKNIFMRFATSIGLHRLSPPLFSDNKQLLIERFLLYTNILYIIGFSNMIYRDQFKSRPIHTPPYPTLDSNYNFTAYFQRILSNKLPTNVEKSDEDGVTSCVEEDVFVYLAKCFASQACLSNSIRNIRSAIETNKETSVTIQTKISNLLTKCNGERSAYHHQISKFQQYTKNSKSTNLLLQKIISFNNLMFQFTAYYILDLAFYLPDDLSLPPNHSPNFELTTKQSFDKMLVWLKVSLSTCQMYLRFASDHKYHPFHIYPLIVTLISLCRFGHYYPDQNEVKDTISRGSLLVDRSRSLQSISFLALHYSSILAILK